MRDRRRGGPGAVGPSRRGRRHRRRESGSSCRGGGGGPARRMRSGVGRRRRRDGAAWQLLGPAQPRRALPPPETSQRGGTAPAEVGEEVGRLRGGGLGLFRGGGGIGVTAPAPPRLRAAMAEERLEVLVKTLDSQTRSFQVEPEVRRAVGRGTGRGRAGGDPSRCVPSRPVHSLDLGAGVQGTHRWRR